RLWPHGGGRPSGRHLPGRLHDRPLSRHVQDRLLLRRAAPRQSSPSLPRPLRTSVGSTEASTSLAARFGLVGPTRTTSIPLPLVSLRVSRLDTQNRVPGPRAPRMPSDPTSIRWLPSVCLRLRDSRGPARAPS